MGTISVGLTSLQELADKEPQNCTDDHSFVNLNGFLLPSDGEVRTLGGPSEVGP